MATRHIQTGVGQNLSLLGLIGERGGRFQRVEGQPKRVSHLGIGCHVGIQVGDDPVEFELAQKILDNLFNLESSNVHDRTESVEQISHLTHFWQRTIDQPEQVADTGSRLSELHHRDTAWPVTNSDQWPLLVG